MIFPIGDTPNPRNYTPWVTWTLMAINIGVFLFITLPLAWVGADSTDPRVVEWLGLLGPGSGFTATTFAAQLSAWDLFVFEHGFRASDPASLDLLTAMFMHAGLPHLAGNMLFLWIYGDNVEHRLGRRGFLLAYLSTGALSMLAYAVLAHGSGAPLIGASGAISGVLGLYALMFPGNRVRLLIFLFPILVRTVMVPAWIVLGLYLLLDNVVPLLLGAAGNVAYGAHVGGFVAGVALGALGERRRWQWPWRGSTPRRQVAADGPIPSAQDLSQAIEQGDRRRAVALFTRMPRREVEALPTQQVIVLADWLEAVGYDASAEELLRRGLSRRVPPAERARVHLALGLSRLRSGQGPLAWQHLRRVEGLDPDPETLRAARTAMAEVASP